MNGPKFKDLRQQLGLSQTELAAVLCLSGKQAVSNIETGIRNPSRLAMAVMLSLSVLPERRCKELMDLLISHSGSGNSPSRRKR